MSFALVLEQRFHLYFIHLTNIIGLGAMGYAMARNVRRKMAPTGTLYIFDVYRPACEKFQDEFKDSGPVVIVDSPREAAALSQMVISIVPGAEEVQKVYLNDISGIAAAPKNQDRLMMECSTIDSQTSREIGEALMATGAGIYIDTPVSVNFQIHTWLEDKLP